jgi:hypothetical protein
MVYACKLPVRDRYMRPLSGLLRLLKFAIDGRMMGRRGSACGNGGEDA